MRQTLSQTTQGSTGDGSGINIASLLIASFVVAMCLSIVGLQWKARKQWQGWWRRLATAPLVVLAVWVSVIVAAKAMNPAAHELWTIEIFAWSMITPVYTALLITAKKALEKADQELS